MTTIKQTNPDAIKNIINSYKNVTIKIGFPATVSSIKYPAKPLKTRKVSSKRLASPSVSEVAYFNEYGTDKIPARPFMRLSKQKIILSANRLTKKGIPMVNNGKISIQQLAEATGINSVNIIKETITSLKNPPNSPITIRIKKSSNPLIDTGLMRATVTYVIDVK